MLDPLIQYICGKTGLGEDQVKTGLGLLLRLAQQQMGDDFSKVQSFLPEADQLIAAAPQAEGLGGMASGLLGAFGGGKLAGLASLVSAGEQAGLDKASLSAVAEHAVAFIESQGNGDLAAALKGLL
jgi:hypothetical protein